MLKPDSCPLGASLTQATPEAESESTNTARPTSEAIVEGKISAVLYDVMQERTTWVCVDGTWHPFR